MAGIYIHIPFCKKACHYCNFHFSTSKKSIPQLVNALVKEAELQKKFINETVETIYFGGGTPSILEVADLEKILSSIHKNYSVSSTAEITLEANPDDVTTEKLMAWKALGINRISLGIQSFIEEELQWMNRSHDAKQAIQSVQLIQQYFQNYSIDLIFGSPLLTNDLWLKNIHQALLFQPPHLSCYALTIEEKTVFGNWVQQQKIPELNSDQQAEQFEILMQELKAAGYHHYEISNYAKPGFESKHNSSYWQGKTYLGLGPSAHSYNGKSRFWNVANNAFYVTGVEQENLMVEEESLTVEQKFNEYIMIALRTSEGINADFVRKNWNENTYQHFQSKFLKWLKTNHLQIKNDQITLSQQGKLFADGIAADFFF
jgi:oxygen-independent coproporphyrinogen III oxidase